MTEQPAVEDLRNAAQILDDVIGGTWSYPVDRWNAAVDVRRLVGEAIAKLEAPRFARITQQDMGGAVTLRAAGDRIVRVERNYIVREDSADEERRRAASEPPGDVLKQDAADFANRLARDVDAQIMGFTNVKPEDRALMGQDVDADGE